MSDITEVNRFLLAFVNETDSISASILLTKNEAAVVVAEIARLRSLLGAVTPGQSVADIKEHLRNLKHHDTSTPGD